MAPQKRKERNDDFFFYTISDDEAPIETEDELAEAQPPKKKARSEKEGVWGDSEEDDGALDPDFEFIDGDEDFEDDTQDDVTLEWASEEKAVNLNDLIQKKLEGKKGTAGDRTEGALNRDDAEGEGEGSENGAIELGDEDEEVLAPDGFGMGVASDEEESENEEMPDEPASDDDSVATPVGHPDDEEQGSSEEDEVDEEELEKQRAFFAPEEKQKPKKTDPSSFQGMRLFSRPLLRGIAAAGFEKPTPIQAKTIPFAVEGKDVVGQAVTGSGKTAAFLLPILERLLYRPTNILATRVVVLTPTRELAMQCHSVARKLAAFSSITSALTVGGTSFKSSEASLRSRPDIVIATPGRFIDHMRNSPNFAVDRVEILVLDEADRMLQDGFADELNEIVTTLPKSRQTMLFSATMNSSVDQLIRIGLTKPVRILADSQKTTAGTLVQEFVRLRLGREEKRMGYLIHLCKTVYTDHAIIFFREKKHIHRTRVIFGLLGLSCAELHGDIKQAERTESLESFRRGSVSFLLASDLASRGLDIKGIETVINYETPKNLDDYIHRIGRTARAGRRGVAVTIVTEKDRKFVKTAAKSLQTQDVKLKSRMIDPASADQWQEKVDDLEADVGEILEDEREARDLAQIEMQVTKGENLIKHKEEIMSRPRRTWFETGGTSKGDSARGKDGTQKLRDQLKQKMANGKLSNKDKKRLDSRSERLSGKAMKVRKAKSIAPTKGGKRTKKPRK